ncbi:TCR/Tet family MFS transporter [Sphingomonas sp. QA11]|uniref:TCR/Tet family MFS transporter n=1 Tax=Sphingomonas sp. QA11 TaxID=2950605 RepID=UPI002349A6F9|nr:TCR/Tet family MFS transporter [Sphingomonas sp. QA11]WCM25287.1 TCR/Tet family MFS transporter [Sphingomonas sp. QA11]
MARTDNRLPLIAFIVFIDMAGIGLIIPILPSLVESLSDTDVAHAALIGGELLFAYAAMQFLFAPVIGGLSDRFGRRPVLLGTLLVLAVDYAMMAWAPTLGWLFAGRIISGVMGATWAAANSCIADLYPPEQRGRLFGLLGGAGASGFVLGPAIGGVLGTIGLRLPFVAASVLALAGAVIGYVIFTETLPPERRRPFTLARANPFGTLVRMGRYPFVLGCLATIFLMQLGAQSQLSTWGYFLIERLRWSPLEIGLSVALFGIAIAIAQGLVTGPAIARFGERRCALVSLMFGLPSYVLLAFASTGWMIYLAIVIGAATGVAFPAIQGMMTTRIEEDAQGELQGAVASTVGLTSIIGPLVMTWVFGHFADAKGVYFPGAPFVLASGLIVAAWLLLARTIRRYF